MLRFLWRWLSRLGLLVLVLAIGLLAPVGWTEVACRSSEAADPYAAIVDDPAWQRDEARTLLTYPEWHIVYAYEGYAETLKADAPHGFGFISAVYGFWDAACGVKAKADQLGEAGFASKATIYTIGGSFTLEMLFKAAYEEVLGRIFLAFGASPPASRERPEALSIQVSRGR